MELGKFVATTIRGYLNEQQILKDNIIPEFIYIDGEKKYTTNSIGGLISNNIESIINFYKWFGESKMIDSNKKPIVCYHISNIDFNEFKPSVFGKMGAGIYFTSIKNDIKIHNKNDGSTLYKCYLKIENMLEIENPFSERTLDNDGIIAFRGKNGEEIKIYEPNKVKSVENDGTWDIGNDNIYS